MSFVTFPDLVEVTLSAIAERIDIETGTRVPNPRPPTFVLARRLGGDRLNPVLETARIVFECWATTSADADDLAATVRALLFSAATPGTWDAAAIGGVSIYRVEDVAGPADEPDPLSEQPVASFTLQFLARGTITEESE